MICDERRDELSAEVRGRVEIVNDLHAADAVYHQSCSVNFRTKKAKPQTVLPEPERISKKGRPNTTDEYFQSVVFFLQQHDDEQITVADLVEKMKQLCGENAYSPRYMKKRLMDHFKDEIIIFDKYGTLRDTANKIMQDFYHHSKFKDAEEEKLSILTTAAKLIKSERHSINVSKDVYPSASLISSLSEILNYIPKGLRTFLQGLLAEKENHIKVSTIGQALMQATRPRCLLSPLQIGLAIQIHHNFGSRSLIDTLYNIRSTKV